MAYFLHCMRTLAPRVTDVTMIRQTAIISPSRVSVEWRGENPTCAPPDAKRFVRDGRLLMTVSSFCNIIRIWQGTVVHMYVCICMCVLIYFVTATISLQNSRIVIVFLGRTGHRCEIYYPDTTNIVGKAELSWNGNCWAENFEWVFDQLCARLYETRALPDCGSNLR